MDEPYSENRFPTIADLKEIKQMLLTANRDQILQSVDKIKVFLSSSESLSEILRSDIAEFLCDAVIPFDSVIVCTLYHCIELMTRHVEFFSYNHSCFAIESLLRTLHIIMKSPSSINSLNQCLNLLNSIMKGYIVFKVSPEKKTVENLLHLLPVLLANLSPTIFSKYQTGALILSLVELDVMKWSQEACDSILTDFSCWFSLLIEILESEHPLREELILLCSRLSFLVLRFFHSEESRGEEFIFEINSNLKNAIIKSIIEFLVTVGTPYFDSLSLSDVEKDPSHLENFYQTILCFFNGSGALERTRLTHGLGETGFLQLTTRINSFAGFSHGQKLRRLCVLALFHVILHLSEDVFLFLEIQDFRREVQRGVSELPIDATQWLDLLISPQASLSCKLALLSYLYFYSMTAKSQDMLQPVHPAIAAFIRLTRGIDSSVLLLKLVWFIFVMSQLSIGQNSSEERDPEVTTTMVSLLEAQRDLSLVYTHHPALLYWAFSSEVSPRIQNQVVHLWLRNKTTDSTELDDLMRKSSDARFAILDILQNGWGPELDSAFSSLKSLLVDSDEDDLAANVWFLLPQVLAKFTADSASVTNVDYVIELCALRTPRSLNPSRAIRVASLLPEVLLKSDLISLVPSLSLVFRLMLLGQETEDHRVLSVFARHDGFLLKVMEGLQANVDVSFLSIQIITLLWKQREDIYPKIRKPTQLSKEAIFKLLETDCEKVLSGALVFLQEVLLSNFRSQIFEIEDVDPGFVEILFLEVQNISVKCSRDVSDLCWACFKLFLFMEPIGGKSIQVNLATNPLMEEVISSNLPLLKDSKELREFLSVWMDLYEAEFRDPCFERKLFGGSFAETIRRVGRRLLGDCDSEGQKLFEKVCRRGFFWN